MAKYLLAAFAALLILIVVLPFALNLAGVNIFQYGTAGGGTAGVLLRSADQGETWLNAAVSEERSIRFPGEVFSVAFHPRRPDTVYAGTRGSGLWISESGGAAWKKISDRNRALSANADVYRVRVHPQNPDLLYAVAFQENLGRVFKSEDGGLSFREVYFATASRIGIFDIFLHPGNAAIVRIVTGQGLVLESRNGGTTWRVIGRFTEALARLHASPFNSSEMYVITASGRVWRTFDAGENWSEIRIFETVQPGGAVGQPVGIFSLFGGAGGGVAAFLIDPHIPGRLWAGTAQGLLRSDDAGATWRRLELLLVQDSLPVSGIAVDPGDFRTIFAAAGTQMHRSDDGGTNWRVISLPARTRVSELLIHPVRSEVMFALLGR